MFGSGNDFWNGWAVVSQKPDYVGRMRCPACGSIRDRVIDSRQGDDGRSIRRRRQCESCERRFTTFERLEDVPLTVTKRSGDREPFDGGKVAGGLMAAVKGRPVSNEQIAAVVEVVEEMVRLAGPDASTEMVGREVLIELRAIDRVAALRFASVYKSFEDVDDFAKEISLLAASDAESE